MKLGSIITSERGKPVTKTGNQNITINLLDENGNEKYLVIYSDIALTVYEIVNDRGAGKRVFYKELKSNGNLKHGNQCYIEHKSGQYAGCSIPHIHD